MTFHEVPRVSIKRPRAKRAMPRSPREVRDAAEVDACRGGSVAPRGQAAPIGRHERCRGAVAQPLRVRRVNGTECIHDDVLRWGAHRRRCVFSCEAQRRAPVRQKTRCVHSLAQPPCASGRFVVGGLRPRLESTDRRGAANDGRVDDADCGCEHLPGDRRARGLPDQRRDS